jgi:ribosomal protein S18 acetylase RimI-like enzyme
LLTAVEHQRYAAFTFLENEQSMIIEVVPTEDFIAAQIHAVAQVAYMLEAEWIGCTNFPPLRQSLDQLQQSSDRFLVFQESGNIIGVLSFDSSTDSIVITRLVVSPARLRQGIATALILALERKLPQATDLAVSTAEANTAAIHFYERHGFTAVTHSRSVEGIPLLHFTKSYI